MAFLYILQIESSGRYYVGWTNDLDRRLTEHNRAHSLATRGRGPWKLAYREKYPSLIEARQREREIKNWKSTRQITALRRVDRAVLFEGYRDGGKKKSGPAKGPARFADASL